MVRKFRKINVSGNSKVKERCTTTSLTIPDQTLTIREIMQRFVSGTLAPIELDYDYNEDSDDFRGIDPADVFNQVTDAKSTLDYLKDKDNKRKEKADRLKLETEIREKILKEQENGVS